MIIPYIMENKNCSKTPISLWFFERFRAGCPSAIYHYLSMVAIHQLTHQHSLQPGALMPVTDRSDLALILMTLVVLAACDGGDGEEI